MRQALSIILLVGIFLQLAAAGPDTAGLTTKITGMPLGSTIELRLKNKEKLRGSRGAVSNTSFTLINQAREQQIAFDEVASVKLLTAKPHSTRNILIGVGITLVVLGIIGSRV
jgi:hypothetical protein